MPTELPRPFGPPLAALLALLALASCDEIPRDPDGTLDRVRGGTLRVGLMHQPPWVDLSGPAPRGVEVALAGALADELGATVEWVPAGEAAVLHALDRGELDLVVGGLVETNPWSRKVAFTRPYLTARLVAAARDIAVPLDSIDGLPVLVDRGTVEPALVESAGGRPVLEEGGDAMLEAKPGWALEPGETAVHVLATDRHVVAVPQGENAWLIRVDRFLAGRGGTAAYTALAVE